MGEGLVVALIIAVAAIYMGRKWLRPSCSCSGCSTEKKVKDKSNNTACNEKGCGCGK